MKKVLALTLAIATALSFAGCTSKPSTSEAPKTTSTMTLATTTSTQDSGLLDYLLPLFEKDSGIKVKVIAKGTGEAIALGQKGDADCLLVHAKAQELQFVKDGWGVERFDVCYNDFIIVGPKDDPAKLKEKAPADVENAFKIISDTKTSFITRGDGSGTETKEKSIWKIANITPSGSWYISAGKGMGAVLQMASEKKSYTLSDRATFLTMKDKLDLQIVTEKSKDLLNQYGVIMVNPKKYPSTKVKEATTFINWILSDKGQKLIGEYGKDKFGISLFIPNAKK